MKDWVPCLNCGRPANPTLDLCPCCEKVLYINYDNVSKNNRKSEKKKVKIGK